jgi:hypothetical protein
MRTSVQQMREGMLVEREHTLDPAHAAAIACDHLQEMPDYYTRLRRMELGAAPTFQFSPTLDPTRNQALLFAVLAGLGGVVAAYFVFSE